MTGERQPLEIRRYGDPVLRERAAEVKRINRSIKELLDGMAEAMYAARGVGLAAPQVGVSRRIVVVDVGDGLVELINPEIVHSSGEATAFEGCLSVPGFIGEVTRAAEVRVTGLDRNGRRIWVEGEGLLARALQHELDHLDGVLFLDRATRVREVKPETELEIIFCGTPGFAVPVLDALLDRGCRIAAVITQPDRPVGRGRRVKFSPVKARALEEGLEVWQPERLSDPGIIRQIRELEPDVLVTAAYGRIVPREVLAIPTRGCINVHASLLPKYRGAAPIQWALMQGETVTGITTFFMDEGMDTGDIILQAETAVGPEDTAGTLQDRLAELGARVLLRTLRLVAAGEAPRRPQDHGAATYAPRLTRELERIDWSRPAGRLADLFRALDPHPGAYTDWRGRRLKIFKGSPAPVSGETTVPGQVLAADPGAGDLVVATGEGALALYEVQPENARRMTVAEFLRGADLAPGNVLG